MKKIYISLIISALFMVGFCIGVNAKVVTVEDRIAGGADSAYFDSAAWQTFSPDDLPNLPGPVAEYYEHTVDDESIRDYSDPDNYIIYLVKTGGKWYAELLYLGTYSSWCKSDNPDGHVATTFPFVTDVTYNNGTGLMFGKYRSLFDESTGTWGAWSLSNDDIYYNNAFSACYMLYYTIPIYIKGEYTSGDCSEYVNWGGTYEPELPPNASLPKPTLELENFSDPLTSDFRVKVINPLVGDCTLKVTYKSTSSEDYVTLAEGACPSGVYYAYADDLYISGFGDYIFALYDPASSLVGMKTMSLTEEYIPSDDDSDGDSDDDFDDFVDEYFNFKDFPEDGSFLDYLKVFWHNFKEVFKGIGRIFNFFLVSCTDLIDMFTEFFSFLPKEVIGLFTFGIVAVIILRFLGR